MKKRKLENSNLFEAMYYDKRENLVVQCLLCPHHCILSPGSEGLCQVRRNIDGILYSLNYGLVSSINFDPIEKKPLYHFHPGKWILSLGTLGCNLSCSYCQNYNISQLPRNEIDRYFEKMTQKITPEDVASLALDAAEKKGNIGVAYTYNEPSIWYEFVLEAAKEVKKQGLKNVLVTNGHLEKEPLEALLPYIDAVNVDIKSIRESFYRKLCGGKLQPVLDYCKMAKEKAHLEVTNLVVTGENDTEEDFQALVDWIAENLGSDTPIHFSRYHPSYQFDAPPTPITTLAEAYTVAIEKLDYVYVGNVWEDTWNSTRCPSCHKIVIERAGYQIDKINLKDKNRCPFCNAQVAVIIE